MHKADPRSLKGRRVEYDAPREPARKTIAGSSGHFTLGAKNMGDVEEERSTRTTDALLSPCVICCYQGCTIQTATNLYGSTQKSSGLYGGWILESPHRMYDAQRIPVPDSMIKAALKGDGSALAGTEGLLTVAHRSKVNEISVLELSLIHIRRCRRYSLCRSRWSPYH